MIKIEKLILSIIAITLSYSAQSQGKYEEQHYRPNFHFTPKSNWMNDPNGLFYANGIYHLYFQHWPYGNLWGPMHWGHATSKDLIKWEEQPIALYPDRFGYIFSGSAVYDVNNTSGFGKDGKTPAVAIFTYHDPIKDKAGKVDVESQGIAYSLDNGLTWTKYDEGNPVMKNPGIHDFRDPKVTWDWVHNTWILILAAKDRAQLYSSPNLKDWTYLSDFEDKVGKHGVWECPDFFPIKVKGTNQVKWVLLQSFNPGGANGGSGTQYFIGDFDGKNFVLDKDFEQKLIKEKGIWLDYGHDSYASVSWGNAPDEREKKYITGWMINLDYANDTPTNIWRGTDSMVKEIELVKDKQGYRLNILPTETLKKYISSTETIKKLSVNKSIELPVQKNDLTKSEITLDLNGLKKGNYSFTLYNQGGDILTFGVDNTLGEFYIDRSQAANGTTFEKRTKHIAKMPLTANQKNMTLKLLLDKTSIEIFYNNGEKVMTEIFFTKEPFTNLKAESTNKFSIENIVINQLDFK